MLVGAPAHDALPGPRVKAAAGQDHLPAFPGGRGEVEKTSGLEQVLPAALHHVLHHLGFFGLRPVEGPPLALQAASRLLAATALALALALALATSAAALVVDNVEGGRRVGNVGELCKKSKIKFPLCNGFAVPTPGGPPERGAPPSPGRGRGLCLFFQSPCLPCLPCRSSSTKTKDKEKK